jgi:SanA protein
MKMKRRILLGLVMVSVLAITSVLGALTLVRNAAAGRLYSSTAEIPHRHVGLLLGCSRRLGNGAPNPFFASRLRAATDLFRAGKVDYLLVSGDNHTPGYDEATDMRDALLQEGVPAQRIYSDCAGFRTLDSIVRARDVFRLTELTVISQEFHNQRAIFLASHNGIDAIGYNAQDEDLGDVSGTHQRERMARVKAALDVYILRTKPHFLGPKVAIGVDAPTLCSRAQ